MQRPAGIDQRREPAASDRAAAVLAGIVDRVLFERPETGYRVLRVERVGERDPWWWSATCRRPSPAS